MKNPGIAEQQAPVLQVEKLVVEFPVSRSLYDIVKRKPARSLRAVDNVSFDLEKNRTIGIVGESGGGKSTVGRVIMQLIRPRSGAVKFKGIDLVKQNRKETSRMRREIQMVFQDPYSSLNPSMTVGQMIKEPLRFHKIVENAMIEDKARELLETVGLSHDFMKRRPKALSGGERQRVGLARALAVNPSLLILDEPVAALDVSIQAQVLNLLLDLRRQFGLSMVFIAHELSVVRYFSDSIAVMYLGDIVEQGSVKEVFEAPAHPYTQRLLSAIPRIQKGKRHRNPALGGEIPSPLNIPQGCRFHPRCPKAKDICLNAEPGTSYVSKTHSVSCHFYENRTQSDNSTEPSRVPLNAESRFRCTL